MQDLKYIFGHGSLNRFVMIDTVENQIDTDGAAAYVRRVCEVFESDGLLFLERVASGHYAMNMYNTDGTQAEMCGNGMRLVARLEDEKYLDATSFTLYSGGSPYPIVRGERMEVVLEDGGVESIPTYGVEIAIKLSTSDFALSDAPFIESVIEDLHPTLKFTYLNLGNPHIVAEVDDIDLELLSALGERVKVLTSIFPKGINVSFMRSLGEQEIFVATYERGVGLTPSCGTAMTASSTAAALIGRCAWGREITVRNRGGFVKCVCHKSDVGELKTQLIGNASYIERGVITSDFERVVESVENREIEAWNKII